VTKKSVELNAGDLVGRNSVNRVRSIYVGRYNVRVYIEDVDTGSTSCWRYGLEEDVELCR